MATRKTHSRMSPRGTSASTFLAFPGNVVSISLGHLRTERHSNNSSRVSWELQKQQNGFLTLTHFAAATLRDCALLRGRRHARRSARGRDDARGNRTDRAARPRRRAPGHNGDRGVPAKRASFAPLRAPRLRNAAAERVREISYEDLVYPRPTLPPGRRGPHTTLYVSSTRAPRAPPSTPRSPAASRP